MTNFTHLHVHSHYSLLDGLPKIPDLVTTAAENNMTALALTDHGVLYGAIEFYKQAKRAGIKPIIGVEAYMARGSLHSKSGRADADYFHLVLLARDYAGYKNLMELVTISHLEGYYYKPRIDKETLSRLSGGLIGLSACLRGEIPQAIIGKNWEQAQKLVNEYQQIFGPGGFYLELQRNMKKPVQEALNQELIRLSRETNLPLVATNDSHYLKPEDNMAQDIMVCVGTGRTVNEADRLDMREVDLHLKTADEMAKSFADIPEALENTGKIADLVDLELPLGKKHFPSFVVPDGYSAENYFETLCLKGIASRYKIDKLPADVLARLEYEMTVIKDSGFATYLLIVADFANWARQRGIIATTRGSAAGSLAAYALGITSMNPLEYKLPFERFLTRERPTPPDIDMDFADNRRDEVLQYVSEKYGVDHVAQIVTFGTMMARAAVRDVGRALGIPYSKCDRIAKLIPIGKQGFHMTIEKALTQSPELKEAYGTDEETRNLIELAKKVEGCARHASIHAAGVVISPTKLTNYTPLQLDTDNKNIITQYDMHSVEDAGLIKMDFLGIRNLSILGTAVEIVRATKQIEVDLPNLPLDDPKTFKLLALGRTMGVFQLGGSGMTKYLVELKPTNIFDIMAMISLYRPGPMESIPEFIRRKHNSKLISYLDPRLKDILETSYGVITYQDDVLLIAIKIAGYTWEEADKLRKAMGKKIPKEMAAQKEKFIQGAISGEMSTEKAVKLWSLIEPFAAYGFNKAHAASYANVAYQTAYMKANFPVEFMAALATAESDDTEKIAEIVNGCGVIGIQVLPPDVNESLANFTVIDEKQIRFGLSAIKNLGSDVIAQIIAERKEGGQFTSLSDFARRIKTRNFNKKSWEALVKSGSLDRFGERNQMLSSTEEILEYARSSRKQEAAGQSALFGGRSIDSGLKLKDVAPATEQEKLSWEKELLGLYVTSHPLEKHRDILRQYCTAINSIRLEDDDSYLTIGGIITRVQNIITKKGDQMCFADIEDLQGTLELVVFPNVFLEHKAIIATDQIVLARGKISDKDGEIKMLVDGFKLLGDPDINEWIQSRPARNNWSKAPVSREEPIPASPVPNNSNSTPALRIKIPQTASPEIFSKLKIIFSRYPGNAQVSLLVPDREGTPREVKTNFLVANTNEFKERLKSALKESIGK